MGSPDGSRGKVLEPWDGSRKVLSSEGLVVGRSWISAVQMVVVGRSWSRWILVRR
jgi:hypothetical protein